MFAWLSGVFRNVASCLQRPQRPAKHEGGDQKVQESELKELPFLDLAGSEQQELKLRTQPSSAHLDGELAALKSACVAWRGVRRFGAQHMEAACLRWACAGSRGLVRANVSPSTR